MEQRSESPANLFKNKIAAESGKSSKIRKHTPLENLMKAGYVVVLANTPRKNNSD